jgi:hypothetical protein
MSDRQTGETIGYQDIAMGPQIIGLYDIWLAQLYQLHTYVNKVFFFNSKQHTVYSSTSPLFRLSPVLREGVVELLDMLSAVEELMLELRNKLFSVVELLLELREMLLVAVEHH